MRSLDGTRPVSNGICSLWSGLDYTIAEHQNQAQNAAEENGTAFWARIVEPFTNGLDIAGYNYFEEVYREDHERFPDRVIMGSENFPREIGFRWPLVESLPYVVGEFTWTAWDYLGEAGIGKTVYVDQDDPAVARGPWGLMPNETSFFPWRTANDADYDITGKLLPQGIYRSVVWGDERTYLYTKHPDTFGKVEVSSMWGFPYVVANWSYPGYENKPIELVVYSNADEVKVFINGQSVGRKPVCMERPFPNTATFAVTYQPGTVEAVSYKNGIEVSRAKLQTVQTPAQLCLVPEKTTLKADGHDVVFVDIQILDQDGQVVPDAAVKLRAKAEGAAVLAGFGTGNPITDEDYTDDATVSYRGHATAVLRSGYEAGEVTMAVAAEGMAECSVRCTTM